MTIDEATKILTILQAAFPHPPLTTDRLKLYAAKLAPLDFKAATLAVDALTDDLNYFPTVKELKASIEAVTPMAPALPPGRHPGQPTHYLFRTFNLDLDEYVELPEPIPDTDPRYAEMLAASRNALRAAGAMDRERQKGQAA